MSKTSNRTPKNRIRASVYILTLVASIFGVIGGAYTYSSYDFSENALKTTGTVINVSSNYRDGSITYRPTISFVDHRNIKHSAPTMRASNTYNFRTGEKVDILYDYRNPQILRVDNWFSLWGFGFVFLGIGMALAAAALILQRSGSAARLSRASDKPRFRTINPKHLVDHERAPPDNYSVIRRMR